jgi:hypothetical protein
VAASSERPAAGIEVLREVEPERCDRCAARVRELRAVRQERDALLLDLARAREQAEALVLSWPGEPITPPPGTGALRHRAADALNDAVKRLAPGVHHRAKRLATRGLALLRHLRHA